MMRQLSLQRTWLKLSGVCLSRAQTFSVLVGQPIRTLPVRLTPHGREDENGTDAMKSPLRKHIIQQHRASLSFVCCTSMQALSSFERCNADYWGKHGLIPEIESKFDLSFETCGVIIYSTVGI